MEKKSILAVFLIVFLGISLIITIPLFTLSIQLSTYDVIDISDDSFIYSPTNSSSVEKLTIYADRGDIEIQYVSPRVDYFVMIEVNVKMSGNNLAGKDYKDFFEVIWDESSPSPTFIMGFKSNVDKLEVLSLIKIITIIVYLRADIVFDIEATVIEGNIDFNVPFGVIINNIKLNNTKGNLFYDFRYCTLEGNITGIANDGNIELIAYNPEYTRNTVWTYNSIAGDITIDISHINQNKIMNANITGSLVGNDFRDVILTYYDNNANIGARITLNDTVQSLDLILLPIERRSDWKGLGFNMTKLRDLEGKAIGYEFTSTDFPAITNYNLFLIGINQSLPNAGWYVVHLSSS